MQFVELVISDEQALMTRLALDIVLNDPANVMEDDEREAYERLAVFFGTAAANPSAFPVTGRMAPSIKKIVQRAKGPAQPQSRRNKRKVRQERRMSFAKRRRKQRREDAENFNRAMEALRRDAEEAEAAAKELEARYEAEERFAVFAPDGETPVLLGVPASAIKPMAETDFTDGPDLGSREPASHVILPGTAEALGLE